MPAPTGVVDDGSSVDIELWDGAEVVRGQPTPSHEAIRVEVAAQLRQQVDPTEVVVASHALEEGNIAPRSDGAVIDVTVLGHEVLVWVEVVSSADLRAGDARLFAGARTDWLFRHGVRSLWVLFDAYGTVTLTVLHHNGRTEAHVSPDSATVSVESTRGRTIFTLDLATVLAVASRIGD